MSLSLFARKAVMCWCLTLATPGFLFGQSHYAANGLEYPILGALPGDQIYPQVSLRAGGGFMVWQDNITDGDGAGISAIQLDGNFSAAYGRFRVNAGGVGDQEFSQVTSLNGGGAAFVWQGGRQGYQHIYARFLSSSNTWLTDDILVSTYTKGFQSSPVIASLANGNLVVAWASYNQAAPSSLRDIYAQIFSPVGQKIGGEILVNQFTSYNQRDPAITGLTDGRFAIVWISEQQRSTDSASVNTLIGSASVDIYGRIFGASGIPAGNEFLVNAASNVCSSPRLASSPAGSFLAVWTERMLGDLTNSLDIVARTFSSSGPAGTTLTVNSTRIGDQYAPAASFDGSDYMVVWTSLGQDGSGEGIFARYVHPDATFDGDEFQVNTTVASQQRLPTVASDGQDRFLVAWTSFGGGINSFDLFAQVYVNAGQPLQAMQPPFVNVPFTFSNGVYQPQVQLSWPSQPAQIDHYDIYVDDAPSPTASISTNSWVMTSANGLIPGSTHAFRVAYVSAGRASPLSLPSTATVWSGYSWGGVPFEWMAQYYGAGNMISWPSANSTLAPDGPTLIQAFLTGANPVDASTWLKTKLVSSAQGYFLNWNPVPGLIYQVQTSVDLNSWVNLGSPRFAVGNLDSLYVGSSNVAYYRVVRLR